MPDPRPFFASECPPGLDAPWPPDLTYDATYHGVTQVYVKVKLPEGHIYEIERSGRGSVRIVGTQPPELEALNDLTPPAWYTPARD